MTRSTLILLMFFLSLMQANSQETMYTPEGSTIYFGNTNPAGIFGYFRNNGNVSMHANAQLHFMGKIWINDSKGTITDTSTTTNSTHGGTVHFVQPNAVYGNLGQQIVHSNYSDSLAAGPSFANIVVNNNDGVIITSDMNVLNSVQFKRGHVYLNQYNVVLGDSNNTARLSGYDGSRYFVTGTDTLGGFLKYRSVLSNQLATFPIGPTSKVYAPMQALNRGGSDEFFARAFNHVFSNATNGFVIRDSTLQVTWNVGKRNNENSEVLITLQHDVAFEDQVFSAHRQNSYVSMYNNVIWDKPATRSTPQMPGSISSTFSISSAVMNARPFVMNKRPLFLTKRVFKAARTFEIPNVFSPNGDNINDRWNIKGLSDHTNCVVEIYNRYGQLLWQSVGYNQPWDGTYNGSPLPVATYYYIINLRNGDKPIGGSVTILK